MRGGDEYAAVRRARLDTMLAAQALVRRATLVTFNADDCRDVAGLRLESW